MSALQRTGAIALKEIRQLARDRLTFAMIIGIPMILILLFGYAINMDVRNLRTGIADQAGTQNSRWLISELVATQVIAPVRWAASAEELEQQVRAAGYASAVTTLEGPLRSGESQFALSRKGITEATLFGSSGRFSEELLQVELSGFYDTLFLRRWRDRRIH